MDESAGPGAPTCVPTRIQESRDGERARLGETGGTRGGKMSRKRQVGKGRKKEETLRGNDRQDGR